MSSTTLHPIEIFYGSDNDVGVIYQPHVKKNRPSVNVQEYARYLNVSSDGCQTTKDVDLRSQMLKSVVRAHENGWLIR